ncbi:MULTISPECIES: gliding motility-associated ABC transporter substrate-binding protein GldG [unclassified Spirosoma]|uniref:gliding motility-associated ABC transporter substrate-binding protein GldG n=1 Tax=unclassified Spirosoma TaxID=2621999 RepID=UPI00095A4FFA|nr:MULTISPECIES: gliding motility-associated ABC transporter substrate-binding protein GldG [unclassified Spirosoma]MBN8824621.1 gliding motility-associated ABC transporter substrate-binding protein GldG [Spirosoma sp.]OJW78825.1 MAG: gliding motility-associated ABC transporter substrate-binding protein GldG [Spirosoma sp. 48-14]
MNSARLRTLLLIAALIAVNVLSAFVFFRIDLTQEKRFTLSEATQNLLANLPDDVHIDVYLTGDLPPGFKRLENAVRETLDGFQAEAAKTVTYRFINPDDVTAPDARNKLIDKLQQKGLLPTNLFDNEGGKRTEKLIFPGAIVSYKGQEVAVQLLKGNKTASPQEQLNQSYEGVEFQLASAIRKLSQTKENRKRVGLVFGHTQVPPSRFSDLLASVQENYDLFFVDMNKPGPVENVDLLLVTKPDKAFSDDEIFKLDQFVVKGGRALFFVDGQRVDSVSNQGTYAQPLSLNLDDLFFRWGIRMNRDVVKDMYCAPVPFDVGNMGDKPNIQLVPWRFYPMLNNFGTSNNPIVRNLDAVLGRFVSTVDTVHSAGIQKTPLLLTSAYTKLLKTPALISYNEARQQPDPATYTDGPQIVGCLLEGNFQSLYANRILPGDPRAAGFKAEGVASRVLVCSDGDLIVNDVDYKRQTPYPLGFDRYTRTTFANKDFALNAIDYLIDPNGVIAARNRVVTLRPLDKIQVDSSRTSWQALNLLGPLVLLSLVGVVWQFIRRRSYGQ